MYPFPWLPDVQTSWQAAVGELISHVLQSSGSMVTRLGMVYLRHHGSGTYFTVFILCIELQNFWNKPAISSLRRGDSTSFFRTS